jgi:tetratricopeptide (TPR) repeat protein
LVSVAWLVTGCSVIDQLRPPTVHEDVINGEALLKMNHVQEAQNHFKLALQDPKSDSKVYFDIVERCQRLNQHNLVIEYAKLGLESGKLKKPTEQALMHLVASQSYSMMRNPEKSIEEAKIANKLVPNNVEVMNNLGYSLAAAGQELDLALELTTKAVAMARQQDIPKNILGIYVDSLGWALFQKKQYDQALSTLVEAAQLAPEHDEIHYHAGRAFMEKGKYEDAQIELERALAIKSDNDEAAKALETVKAKRAEEELKNPPAPEEDKPRGYESI